MPQVVGYIKAKSAIHFARMYEECKRHSVGHQFCTRDCFVSTAGRDEAAIRAYFRRHEQVDQWIDQMQLLR